MVNMHKLRLTRLQEEILRFLFVKAGKPINALAIAKSLNVSQPAVSKSIPLLEKEGLITAEKDKDSGRFSIEMNIQNRRVMQLKRADNLKRIYESGLSDFLEEKFAGATIILFGSYSRGEDTLSSDIDIAIIGRKEKEIEVEAFEKIFEREIVLQFYGSLKEVNKNLRENLCNGIVLTGGIEL